MNILLVGGMGYIGSHTALVLANAGFQVVIYDNLSNSHADILDRLNGIAKQEMPFIEGDVRNTLMVRKVLREFSIDAVIHFAGLKSVVQSTSNPIEYFENNVIGSISLFRAMADENVKSLVFSSSAAVYGLPNYLPLDESHPTLPINPYGRSKLYIEEMLVDIARSDLAWRVVCLRYFNPVGAHDSGLIGEMPNSMPNNLVPLLVEVAAGRKPMLRIYGNDYNTKDGTGIRDYIHVMDLAEGHAAAINFIKSHSGWEEFNLGTGRGYSVLEMISEFEKISGCTITHKFARRRIGDVPQCYANPSKAAKLLHWRASRGLREMCSSTWKFQSQGIFPSLMPDS